MNETERYIVAAAFAASDHQSWPSFARRMKQALEKLDEVDGETDEEAKAKRLAVWEALLGRGKS